MSNAPIVKDVVKAARSVAGDQPGKMAGTQLAEARASEARATEADKRMQRRERATEAAETGRLRAARGRGRGYRSLMSRARSEDGQSKGGKTTLGG